MSDLKTIAPQPVDGDAHTLWSSIGEALRGSASGLYCRRSEPLILLLAIPMVLEMVLESLFAVVDVFWVGRLGADAVATVGITETLLALVFAIGLAWRCRQRRWWRGALRERSRGRGYLCRAGNCVGAGDLGGAGGLCRFLCAAVAGADGSFSGDCRGWIGIRAGCAGAAAARSSCCFSTTRSFAGREMRRSPCGCCGSRTFSTWCSIPA